MVHDDSAPPTDPTPSNPASPLPDRTAAIGARLRQIFDEAAAEPIPDAFSDLLRKLG